MESRGSASGSQNTWASKWVCMSTKPGGDDVSLGVEVARAGSSMAPARRLVRPDAESDRCRGCPGSVDQRSVANDEIEHGSFPFSDVTLKP